MSETVHDRLERIEDKVDKMADAIVALARVEEKIVAIEQNSTVLMRQVIAIDERITDVEKKQHVIEIKQTVDSNAIEGIKKFSWTVASALIGALVLYWFTNLATHQSAANVDAHSVADPAATSDSANHHGN